MTKQEFIKEVTAGLAEPPAYFPLNVRMNKEGYESMDAVMERGNHALSPDAFEAAANETDALLLDTRDPQTFAKGFVPNSINIGIDVSFAPWVGALVPDIKHKLLIITDEHWEEEVITRLARVGYDYTIGYLKGGFKAWEQSGKETETIISTDVNVLANIINNEEVNLIDVRHEGEFIDEHVDGAINLPLDYINESMTALEKGKTYYVYCGSGYRSMIFTSILKARGFDNLIDIKGGFKTIKESGEIKTTDFVCPTTLKKK
jgi:rhodanese-related sulfurtransferase